MDIDTSTKDAARRNLVALSMGFLLFAIGDAQLGDGTGVTTITILAGSITFNNPTVLAVFAWIMLVWFLIRYWQFTDHKQDWITYTTTMYNSTLMKKWLNTQNQATDQYNGNQYQPLFGNWEWPATVSSDGTLGFVVESNDLLKKLHLFLHVAIKTEKFGQFYLPYLLSLSAIVLTLCL